MEGVTLDIYITCINSALNYYKALQKILSHLCFVIEGGGERENT